MVCPHCQYSDDEYDFDTNKTSEGDKGGFFKLPIEMKRSESWMDHEITNVRGCPNCKKVFID